MSIQDFRGRKLPSYFENPNNTVSISVFWMGFIRGYWQEARRHSTVFSCVACRRNKFPSGGWNKKRQSLHRRHIFPFYTIPMHRAYFVDHTTGRYSCSTPQFSATTERAVGNSLNFTAFRSYLAGRHNFVKWLQFQYFFQPWVINAPCTQQGFLWCLMP